MIKKLSHSSHHPETQPGERLRICFIINPISGINRNPQKIVRWIETTLEPSGHEFEILYTRESGDGARLAREAVEKGCDMVTAVGGDGTINEVGSGLVNSAAALGVIPAGSGNGFSRNFSIPLDQRKAIRLLLNPAMVRIDVGRINNRFFFNVAGIGLDAEISRYFEQFGIRGSLPYFFVGTRAFVNYRPDTVKISFSDRELEVRPLVLSIANASQYGNGAVIAPQARPDDGLLDLCILDPMPVWKAVQRLPRLFNGTINQVEGFQSYQVDSLTIRRSQPGFVHTDGNPFWEAPVLHIEVLPKALRLAVPGKTNP